MPPSPITCLGYFWTTLDADAYTDRPATSATWRQAGGKGKYTPSGFLLHAIVATVSCAPSPTTASTSKASAAPPA